MDRFLRSIVIALVVAGGLALSAGSAVAGDGSGPGILREAPARPADITWE